MTAPVRDEPPPVAPEELVLGSDRDRRVPRWTLVVALVLGLVVVATATAWHFWPRPVEPLSLADLQNTYYGIVRSDGTNDASTLTRRTIGPAASVSIAPALCTPLIQATLANQFPDAALDGVGTYWIGSTSTVSLFTLRFADKAAAQAELARIAAALDACADRQLVIHSSQDDVMSGSRATVSRTPTGAGDDGEIGYLLSSADEKMAIQLLPYENTLSWQYRYETGSGSYSPLAADQVMYSLRVQLDAIMAARPQ